MYYDEINQADIVDLRNSSKKVEDYNRLITREFNKLIAGTTRGKEREGSFNTIRYFPAGTTAGNMFTDFPEAINNRAYTKVYHYKVSTGVLTPCYILQLTGININTTFPIYKISDNLIVTDRDGVYLYASRPTSRTKSNTLLHCDIIGNPINYPTAWKESGVFGTPLIVAEDGTSLLPNGTLDAFKLSRDANDTPLLCLRSTDNGATWASFTPVFSATSNTLTLTDEPAGNIVLVYYQTKTTMATPTVNSSVLAFGDILTTQSSGAFMNTLINKSNTVIGEVVTYTSKIVQFVEKPLLAASGILEGQMLRQNYYGYNPSHSAITLYHNTNIPTVKVFPYLTRLNGKAYLTLVFKEMKHNGTSWGDDAKFNIVDNVSTTTDLNAQTVLIGQKGFELPYFLGADE